MGEREEKAFAKAERLLAQPHPINIDAETLSILLRLATSAKALDDPGMVERAAVAIYDAEDSQSGDTIGTVIWNSDHLFYDALEGEEIVDRARRVCMPVCRDAARAVLASLKGGGNGSQS